MPADQITSRAKLKPQPKKSKRSQRERSKKVLEAFGHFKSAQDRHNHLVWVIEIFTAFVLMDVV
jgi:hypothetical protein